MFEGVKPFDWLMLGVEAAVLLLILYEVVVGIARHRKTGKRQKELDNIVEMLSEFIGRGQKLLQDVPKPSHDPTYDALAGKIDGWINSVGTWGKETTKFLEHRSQRAATAFGLIARTGILANPQIIYTESGDSFPIGNSQREAFQRLATQLSNLRSIMEKPEVYF